MVSEADSREARPPADTLICGSQRSRQRSMISRTARSDPLAPTSQEESHIGEPLS